MPEKEAPIPSAKKPEETQQVKNQNQHHNTKKQALGPNTRR